MTRLLLLCSFFLLAGCPGPGDRLPDMQLSQVTFVGNQPCITYPVASGDRITSIQIGSTDSDSFRQMFDENPLYPASGDCLPTFSYRFEANKSYTVYYSLDNDNRERQKIIEAHFTIAPRDTAFRP